MTRSEPPNGTQPAGRPSPPAQYPPAQYQPAQYPPDPYPPDQYSSPQYPPAHDPAAGAVSSLDEYGQPPTGSDTSTVALPAGQPEHQPMPADAPAPQQQTPAKPSHRPTRTGAAWVALIVAAIVLIFLLIFIVQNSGPVQIRYFGFEGTMPLGVAMLFAAIAGALTAGLLGTVRILQMRKKTRQTLAGK